LNPLALLQGLLNPSLLFEVGQYAYSVGYTSVGSVLFVIVWLTAKYRPEEKRQTD